MNISNEWTHKEWSEREKKIIYEFINKRSNLQKQVTVSSTSNGNIIRPGIARSCKPIDEYRTFDIGLEVETADVVLLLPTIVFNTFVVHIIEDFSVVLWPFRLLYHAQNHFFIWPKNETADICFGFSIIQMKRVFFWSGHAYTHTNMDDGHSSFVYSMAKKNNKL